MLKKEEEEKPQITEKYIKSLGLSHPIRFVYLPKRERQAQELVKHFITQFQTKDEDGGKGKNRNEK